MSNIVINGFGKSGSTVPTLGYGHVIPPTILMSPTTGKLAGGDMYTISGQGLSNASSRDIFPLGAISGSWTNISSGTGSASAIGGLLFQIGVGGGTAGVRTVAAYKSFDVSINYGYVQTIEQFRPAAQITFCHLRARLSSTEHFTVAHIWDPTKGSVLRATAVSSGIIQETVDLAGKTNARSLRLVRHLGRIQAWVGNKLLLDHTGWINNDVNIELASISTTTALAIQTTISSYIPALLVTFNDEFAPVSIEPGPNRIIGYTPAAILPGLVDVDVHTVSTSISVSTQFEYVAPLQLTVSESTGKIIVSNDDTLRDTSDVLPGFRL